MRESNALLVARSEWLMFLHMCINIHTDIQLTLDNLQLADSIINENIL